MSCFRYKRAISWLKLQNSLVYLLCLRQIAVKAYGIANPSNYEQQTAIYRPMHDKLICFVM